MTVSLAYAEQYKCEVNNPLFHDVTDLKTGDGFAIVDVSTSFPLKKAVIELTNGRSAQIEIIKDIFGAGKVVFQLQIYEDQDHKNFVTYIAVKTNGLQKNVNTSGQYFNPTSKLYDEYHLDCTLQ